jgi:hypothetical protein
MIEALQCPRAACGAIFSADLDRDMDEDDDLPEDIPCTVFCPICFHVFDPYAAPKRSAPEVTPEALVDRDEEDP